MQNKFTISKKIEEVLRNISSGASVSDEIHYRIRWAFFCSEGVLSLYISVAYVSDNVLQTGYVQE